MKHAPLITHLCGRARQLLGLAAAFAVLASLITGAATNSPPWFTRVLVGMEVGPTGAQFSGGTHASDYAANFAGREIASWLLV